MTKKQFEAALAEFRTSHEIVASPNTRLQIARCLVELGKPVSAYAEFGRAAVEAKELLHEDHRYQRAYAAAVAERGEIEPKLGFVSLTISNASDETQVTVAGEEVKRAAWNEAAPVTPGTTEIVVSTPGYLPIKRGVTVASGQKASLAIDVQSGEREVATPEPPPAPPPPPHVAGASWTRTGAYVGAGVAVAGLATFTIFGVMARSTYDDLNGACRSGPCPATKANEISAGKTQQTVANVGLAVGLVGAAAGATLFVLSLRGESRAPTAALIVSPGYLGLRGSL
jgi:hypothetical protein